MPDNQSALMPRTGPGRPDWPFKPTLDLFEAMIGDAPFCDVCGHITVRNGTCYKCLNCGNSMATSRPPANLVNPNVWTCRLPVFPGGGIRTQPEYTRFTRKPDGFRRGHGEVDGGWVCNSCGLYVYQEGYLIQCGACRTFDIKDFLFVQR